MNVTNLMRNESGILIDKSGNKVFNNDIFNTLMSVEHISATAPAIQYIDAQANQAFFLYPEDARKYIDLNCSKLLDDNASLANPDINVKNTYLADVACFLAIVSKICDNSNVSDAILGDTFTTKNDDSVDSKIPMYLCIEILRAKCLSYLDRATSPLENFNLTDASLQTSTFNAEFSKVIEKTKQLSYNKEYFGQDISDVTEKWLSACQIDATGSVDLYAKCDQNQCLVFVTQKLVENGQEVLNEKSSPMFVTKSIGSVVNIETPSDTANMTVDSKDVFQNVTVVDNNSNINSEQSGVLNSNTTGNRDYKAELIDLKTQLEQKQQEEKELQERISQLLDQMVSGENNIEENNNEVTNTYGMVA